jgi:hypothetical protein
MLGLCIAYSAQEINSLVVELFIVVDSCLNQNIPRYQLDDGRFPQFLEAIENSLFRKTSLEPGCSPAEIFCLSWVTTL